MIGHIQGQVLFSDGTETILETTSGIGYQIYYNRVLPEGATAALFISHIVKENSEELYGFHSLRAKKLFEMLLTVKNIGPKSAFALMRALAVKDICDAILLDNKKLLTSAPGVGPKAAAQMILDLQTKIQKVKMYSDRPSLSGISQAQASQIGLEYVEEQLPETVSEAGLLQEALMACKELGFKEDKIKPLAMKILSEHKISKPEQLVHLVLKGV